MKVCFFPHYSFSNSDGATLSMYNIIDELKKRDVEVIVILPNINNGILDILKTKDIKYYHIPMYSMRIDINSYNIFSSFKFFYKYIHNINCVNKIYNILKYEKVDLIHINGLDTVIGAKIANKLDIPYVWHIRQFLEEDLGKTLYRKSEVYKYLKNSDGVIAISKSVKDKFEKELGIKAEVIYNGIPIEKYNIENHNILSKDYINIIIPGRISKYKGQMDAIKAIENLLNIGYNNIHLKIIGQPESNEYLDYLNKYIYEKNLDNNISLYNHVDDLRAIRSDCDIGLTCSYKEAFGRVTVENMLSGLLVIGANSGGTKEIIKNGVNGYLYEVNDYKDLASKIELAIKDKDNSRKIANKGYSTSLEKFSIERVVREVLSLYDTIVNNF